MNEWLSNYWTSIAIAIAVVSGIAGQVINLAYKDSPRSKIILLIATVLFGIMAVAGSFYSQYESGVAQKTEIEKRTTMKDLLHNAIAEANSIVSEKRDETQDDANAYQKEFVSWRAKTAQLIEDAYGKPERDVFESFAGVQLLNVANMPTRVVTNAFGVMIQHLTDLIKRADTIAMRPNFDPKSYHPKE